MYVSGRLNAFLHSLPEQFESWRGTDDKRGVDGLSWTLDQEKAVWFAQRFDFKSCVRLIANGVAKKGDILAYFGERMPHRVIQVEC